jgi:hypothetical protein
MPEKVICPDWQARSWMPTESVLRPSNVTAVVSSTNFVRYELIVHCLSTIRMPNIGQHTRWYVEMVFEAVGIP